MSDLANRIVQKLWSYCNVLRDDGLSYQDYLEQLTFLLFLKMADERARLTGEEQAIPAGHRWADLAAPQMEGVELVACYRPGDRHTSPTRTSWRRRSPTICDRLLPRSKTSWGTWSNERSRPPLRSDSGHRARSTGDGPRI